MSYAITVTVKGLKTSKMEVLQKINYINVVYFDVQNLNPMSIFVGRDRKTSLIRKKKLFFKDYEENQIRRQDFLEAF